LPIVRVLSSWVLCSPNTVGRRERSIVQNKEDLRRLMTPNGKIYSRKRLGTSAKEQRMVAQAIKRARFMALLPFTSGTM
ncbi:MAG TPA: 30S ribosomal protein S18, partial [Phycisphaerales bacterium]|nr:30S ribosomal protein S18 [Phycisphaerales bacterium]